LSFLSDEIKNQLALSLFIGLFIGVAAAYTLIASADMRSCPEKNCIGDSNIVPISDRGYFPKVHDILRNAKSSIHIAAFELKYYDRYTTSLQNQLIQDLIDDKETGRRT